MKGKTTVIFAVLSALLLLSVAVVYAHAGSQENTKPTQSFDRTMMDVEEIDEMHDLMTKGLRPELKKQMDIMHEGCISHFKDQDNNEEHMGEVNVIEGKTFNDVMGMGKMMS